MTLLAGPLETVVDRRRLPSLLRARRRARAWRRAPELRALATVVLGGATIHGVVLVADAIRTHDFRGLGVDSMLELQRVWPALGTDRLAGWLSWLVAIGVYAALLVLFTRARRTPRATVEPPRAAHPSFTLAAPEARRPAREERGSVRALPIVRGVVALAAGLAVHMSALAAIEQLVPAFPSVPDVVHQRLPYVDFGAPGEWLFFAFLATVFVRLVRQRPADLPRALTMLGVFYAIRGVFLFLLPIGAPPTAPSLDSRFVLWPFARHAYFPGGHAGMMTILAASVASRPWRRALLAFVVVFAFGTLLARTHYAADALGGILLGWGIVRGSRRPRTEAARRAARAVPAGEAA